MADQTDQSIQGFGALTDMERKTAAYNALAKSYGPAIAYDPTNAFNASKASVEQQTAPTQVQQASANLANTQAEVPLKQAQTEQANVTAKTGQLGLDTMTGLRGIKMLQAIANPDGSIDADTARHLISNPVYGIDQQHVEPLVQRLSQPGGSDLLGNMAQALQAGGKVTGGTQIVTDANGNTHMILHTATGGIQDTNLGSEQTVGQQGIPIRKFNSVSQRIAATQPKGIVVSPTGDVQTVGGGRTTTLPIQSVAGPAGTQAKAAATVVGKSQGTNAANALPQNVAIARADLGQMDLQYGRTQDALGKAAGMVSPFSTGVGAATIGRLPGSTTKALEAQVQTAKSNIALLTANMSRQGGKSVAVAVRNMQEFKAYQDALGAIDVHAAPSVVHQQITTAQQNLTALQGALHQHFQATYGAALNAPQGGAPAAGGWSNLRVSP